jgi:pyruvate oxidase
VPLRPSTPVASWMMNEADLIVAFGVSFSNHTGIASYKPIIQVDLDPMALGRFHPVTTAVLGDVGVTARLLLEQLPDDQPGAARRADQRRDLADRWKIWRHEKQSRAHDDLGDGIGSAMVFEALSRLTPRDAVIAVDVGNNAYSFGRYFECAEQSVLMSGYLGSIGFGFPAAMGAWMANRSASHGRAIVAVTGDGGFGQYMAEFSTAVHHRMNITHVLLNNSQLGKISKEQRALDMDVWQTDLTNPNFADFAVSCGGSGRRVVERSDLDDALKAAFDFDGPALVEIITDPELL